ncbi:MAG TPA: CDP-alcohol phosphatidyltransferase family protein, partial [Candidatus Binatia bacterium]|nr:CDP-alcohol phosphatidyltransferase family protein [Candidatus Binatia bacterium]
VASPVFLIFLTDDRFGAALIVFILAGLTDSLDGAIARLTDSKTKLGAYMDPLADKMLILSAFVVFASMDAVPRWLTVVVISRDVIILIGYLSLFLLTQQLMEIRPSAISKAATFLQLATLSVVLLSLWKSEMVAAGTRSALFGVTGTVTAISGFHYIYRGLRWYQQKGGAPAEAPRLQ